MSVVKEGGVRSVNAARLVRVCCYLSQRAAQAGEGASVRRSSTESRLLRRPEPVLSQLKLGVQSSGT